MNLRTVRVLVIDDLLAALQRPRSYLFLVPYGLFWFWTFRALSNGQAGWLQTPEGSLVAAWLLTPQIAKGLFADNPPTLAVFFLISMGIAPFFTMLATFDQTSSDTRSGFFRFLVLRCSRFEIYLSRFFAAALFVVLALVVAGVVATGLSLLDDDSRTPVLVYSVRVHLALAGYTVAFAALMAAVSAGIASGALAALFGIAGYAMVLAALHFAATRFPEIAVLGLLLPSGVKDHLLAGDAAAVSFAVMLLAVQTAVYGTIGWRLFRHRPL